MKITKNQMLSLKNNIADFRQRKASMLTK